jgi:hypothetical protein
VAEYTTQRRFSTFFGVFRQEASCNGQCLNVSLIQEWSSYKVLELKLGGPHFRHPPEPQYTDRGFLWLYQNLQKMTDNYLDNSTTVSFQILSNSSFTNHTTIRRYEVQLLTASSDPKEMKK